jgi:hypothetical protein
VGSAALAKGHKVATYGRWVVRYDAEDAIHIRLSLAAARLMKRN